MKALDRLTTVYDLVQSGVGAVERAVGDIFLGRIASSGFTVVVQVVGSMEGAVQAQGIRRSCRCEVTWIGRVQR